MIVDPGEVWVSEIKNKLEPISELPIKLGLREIDIEHREETILRFLRFDELFLEQGKDIKIWSENYKNAKNMWLENVNNIIEFACESENLLRHKTNGKFIQLPRYKEQFLLSLDLRFADDKDIPSILEHKNIMSRNGLENSMSAVRLSSLIFWYLYVNIDRSNIIKRQPSDIGDIHQLSLLPYCKVFTADKSMNRLLKRIIEPVNPLGCKVFSKATLLKEIGL